MINTTQRPYVANDQGPVVIRALYSITSEQADTIASIVQTSGQVWDVQTIDDYDGYRSILIEPSTVENEHKGFFISGTAQRLELAETHHDNLASIGTFADIKAIGARLIELLQINRS